MKEIETEGIGKRVAKNKDRWQRILQDLRKIAEDRLEKAQLPDLVTELETMVLHCPHCARIRTALADLALEYNTSTQKRDRPEWTEGFLTCLNMINAVATEQANYCSIKEWLDWGFQDVSQTEATEKPKAKEKRTMSRSEEYG